MEDTSEKPHDDDARRGGGEGAVERHAKGGEQAEAKEEVRQKGRRRNMADRHNSGKRHAAGQNTQLEAKKSVFFFFLPPHPCPAAAVAAFAALSLRRATGGVLVFGVPLPPHAGDCHGDGWMTSMPTVMANNTGVKSHPWGWPVFTVEGIVLSKDNGMPSRLSGLPSLVPWPRPSFSFSSRDAKAKGNAHGRTRQKLPQNSCTYPSSGRTIFSSVVVVSVPRR